MSSSPPTCPCTALVKFAFTAANAAELSVNIGELVTVVSTADPGWWEGQSHSTGQCGLFPHNYVEVLKTYVPSPFPLPQKAPPLPAGGARGGKPAAGAVAAPKKAVVAATAVPAAAPPLPVGRKSANVPISVSKSPAVAHINTPLVATSTAPVTAAVHASFSPQYPAAMASVNALSISFTPNSSRYGHWSYNMALMTAAANTVMGICAILWYQNDSVNNTDTTQWLGVYAILVSLAFGACEYARGLNRSEMPYPLRGLAYIGISIPLYFAMPLVLGGVFTSTVGLANTIACLLKESYVPEKPQKRDEPSAVLDKSPNFWQGLKQYYRYLHQQNQLGSLFFVVLYFAGNIAIFTYQVITWTQLNTNAPSGQQLSSYAPWAKGFGGLLDLNCALIVLPVCRTILRWLYSRSTQDQSLLSRALRAVLVLMPIDHNLSFHKLIARMIMLSVIGHVVLHLINASLAYTNTIAKFGLSPWWTGGVVSLAMLLIYSSVHENVKTKQFELFWYCHHSFVVFIVVLIFHGHGGISPMYKYFIIVPGTLYVCERLLRYYRSRQAISVLSMTLMGDVLSLEFDKAGLLSGYKEGQYLYLQAPAVSRLQWHPFTISSAPQEKSVTVHIRIQGEGSWTRQLSDYMSGMGERGKSYIQLDRMGVGGVVHGKVMGPDGQQLVRIDGPHSAPTQHIGEYSSVMVVGAGIGATPLSSCLSSVVFHKWKYTVGQCYPSHAHFYWVCAHRDIDAFRWLLRRIKECQDEVNHLRQTSSTMRDKSFSVHIFLTSVPKQPAEVGDVDGGVGWWGVPAVDRNVNVQGVSWTEMDLYREMKCPKKGNYSKWNDVHLYQGRPDWKARFGDIHTQGVITGDIGVLYCGNPLIGNDLQKNCHQFNQLRSETQFSTPNSLFKLHKENF